MEEKEDLAFTISNDTLTASGMAIVAGTGGATTLNNITTLGNGFIGSGSTPYYNQGGHQWNSGTGIAGTGGLVYGTDAYGPETIEGLEIELKGVEDYAMEIKTKIMNLKGDKCDRRKLIKKEE